jgi:GNAT superfamily N-acetyltransferase
MGARSIGCVMHKKLSHRPQNQSPDTLDGEVMTNTMEYRHGAYTISTDRARLDLDLIHDYLTDESDRSWTTRSSRKLGASWKIVQPLIGFSISHASYWAQGRPLQVVQRSIEHSLCFGIYVATQQVAFARVVTDYATFAWLCDLFVVESHRGQGLGKWLVECIVAHPELRDLYIFLLATRDAHELYRRYGRFEALQQPDKWMARRPD